MAQAQLQRFADWQLSNVTYVNWHGLSTVISLLIAPEPGQTIAAI